MTATNINEVIKSLKEWEKMKKEVEQNIENLKQEAIEYLTEQEIDEYVNTENGDKITYREVISKRFQSTEFKKLHKDLYEAFTMATSSMRFTLN